MPSRCPGNDFRKLKVQVINCPECKADVEIFSDEVRVRCQKCGSQVHIDRLPSCIEWCASANHCLGDPCYQSIQIGPNERETDGRT